MKKAYRQLSLIYHPDKNPDPAAATYFAEFITKAYKALTGWQLASASPLGTFHGDLMHHHDCVHSAVFCGLPVS